MLLSCISVVAVITTEADVIACYILFYFIYWLMLLPVFCGRCYSHISLAQCGGRCYCQVADGIATVGWVDIEWLMLLTPGRCYSHGSMILF